MAYPFAHNHSDDHMGYWRIEMLKFVDIEVTKVPEGEAPEKIKKEWVGVRMPAIRLESVSGTVCDYRESQSSPWTIVLGTLGRCCKHTLGCRQRGSGAVLGELDV